VSRHRPSPRHVGLDAARAFAMLLVVTAHAAIAFMVTPIGWAIQDSSRFLGADVYVWLAREFAMPTFFWLAGFFARSIYQHGGAPGFVRNRVTRILLPLAIALVPCSVANEALWDWGHELSARPDVAATIPKLDASTLPITLGHLWFLYYLLAISFVAIILVIIARRLAVVAPRGFAILSVAWLIAFPPLAFSGGLQPDTPLGFQIDTGIALHFGAFFAWGWLVHSARGELDWYARRAWGFVAAAALLFACVVPTLRAGADGELARAPLHAIAASAALTVALIAAFLGLCVRYARPRPTVQLAAEASYWIYIVHFPIVVLLQIACSRVDIFGPLEYVAIVVVTAVACLASYRALARVRRVLKNS
jgi:peptidoglycan/LPS O-acetylase OafA/YrhL